MGTGGGPCGVLLFVAIGGGGGRWAGGAGATACVALYSSMKLKILNKLSLENFEREAFKPRHLNMRFFALTCK